MANQKKRRKKHNNSRDRMQSNQGRRNDRRRSNPQQYKDEDYSYEQQQGRSADSNRRKSSKKTPSADRQRKNEKASRDPIKIQSHVRINPGIILFLALFVYIIVMVISYFKSEPITPYEVKMGSLAINNKYTGVALREETVVESAYSGYINYYARENEKVNAYSMVYTVDSTGKLSEMVNNNTGEGTSLSNDDLSELKNEISLFANNFSPSDYRETYDFKYNIEGTVLKLANSNILNNIDTLREKNYTDSIDFGYAPSAGVIVYSTDGYENKTPETLTLADMDYSNYVKNQFKSNDLISSGDGAYKLITSELWSIIVEVEEERALQLENESYVEVRFLKNNYKSWSAVSVLRQNGKSYAKLDFNNSMVTFSSDRFIEIEILNNAEEGLKVPLSAIVKRPFYLIPVDYLTYGSNLDEPGFIKESYSEDGTLSSKFEPTEIYYSTEEYYYVDQNKFEPGDYISKLESDERYEIRDMATLDGVYNINKGYADFRQIIILNQNEEYAIVKSNSEYGLSVYDHIVLNGDSVTDKDFIYE